MFDFNKLDKYKVVLDDGLKVCKFADKESDEWCILEKTDDVYKMEVCPSKSNKDYDVEEKDWEEFKNKVANFFLGGK